MNSNATTTEVHLRKRATPYTFGVTVTQDVRVLPLFNGKAYQPALAAYWQAVSILCFLGTAGVVRMNLAENKQTYYGGFATEVENGKRKTEHVPFGHCLEWADLPWDDANKERKIIATVPGQLRPVRYSKRPTE